VIQEQTFKVLPPLIGQEELTQNLNTLLLNSNMKIEMKRIDALIQSDKQSKIEETKKRMLQLL
jgi:hypothetical protein